MRRDCCQSIVEAVSGADGETGNKAVVEDFPNEPPTRFDVDLKSSNGDRRKLALSKSTAVKATITKSS
jgi:hypothetical protein